MWTIVILFGVYAQAQVDNHCVVRQIQLAKNFDLNKVSNLIFNIFVKIGYGRLRLTICIQMSLLKHSICICGTAMLKAVTQR